MLLPAAEPLRAIGLGSVAIWAATGLPRLIDAARFGDLSYGLYIVHFPDHPDGDGAGRLCGGSRSRAFQLRPSPASCAALLLWWLVERPALRSDSAYRVHA